MEVYLLLLHIAVEARIAFQSTKLEAAGLIMKADSPSAHVWLIHRCPGT